jgi:hypothetical protein
MLRGRCFTVGGVPGKAATVVHKQDHRGGRRAQAGAESRINSSGEACASALTSGHAESGNGAEPKTGIHRLLSRRDEKTSKN